MQPCMMRTWEDPMKSTKLLQYVVAVCSGLFFWGGACLLLNAYAAQAASFERKDVTFPSQGLKCAAWYYVPSGLKEGEKRPAIVMAHGFTAVKEMYLDGFAKKFAEAGMVVLVFDYRFFGASEGEPRAQLFYHEQLQDYCNAVTWASMQKEVDANRIGIWGTSYSGGHVMHLGAFDRRIKAVVAQVPMTGQWEAYYGSQPPDQLAGTFGWYAQNRADQYAKGQVNYITVAAPEKEPSVVPLKEWYDAFMALSKNAPNWLNKVTIESLEVGMEYDPTAGIEHISPTPFLMIIASDDIITPTALEKKAFERAKEPKKLIVVPGRHFDAYDGPKHEAFVTPAVEWFKQYLKP
jgi:uncharacterized protein